MTTEPTGQDDRHIKSVLQALGQAEPDAAMRDRLIATLRRAEPPARQTHRRAMWSLLWLQQPCHAASVCALAAALLAAGGTLLWRANLPHRTGTAVAHAGIAGGVRATRPSAATASSGNPMEVAAMNRRRSPGSISWRSEPAPSSKAATPGLEAQTATASGDSFPPPPLPLTEQERLLLRLVRHEPLQQLAQLTGPAMDEALQRERAAVAEFFALSARLSDSDEPTPESTLSSAPDQPLPAQETR